MNRDVAVYNRWAPAAAILLYFTPPLGYDSTMSPDEYRDALKLWGMRHKAAAEFFGFTVITSQRYATGERNIPPTLAVLIRLMIAMKLTPAKVREWLDD